jgi:hypothetical protein
MESGKTNNLLQILKYGVTNAEKTLEETKYIIAKITGNKVHDAG